MGRQQHQTRSAHAALTWFVLFYFIGIFGFPVLGGWILVHLGKEALLAVLGIAAILELAIAATAIAGQRKRKNTA